MAVAEAILAEAKTLPEGAPISGKELLHLGNRAAVDSALARLNKSKELMRIRQGLYVLPVQSSSGSRAPAPEKVVARLAEKYAETVAPHGAAAANKLGLTTQVPAKLIYYTSGRSRKIKLGAQIVEMEHAPDWLLLPGAGGAGEAVRALAWLGKRRAHGALSKLKRTLPKTEVNRLIALRRVLPGWLAQSISRSLVQSG